MRNKKRVLYNDMAVYGGHSEEGLAAVWLPQLFFLWPEGLDSNGCGAEEFSSMVEWLSVSLGFHP